MAQLLTNRHVEPAHDEDYFLYSLRLVRPLRGAMPPHFVIHEGNDSGRAPFHWIAGQKYLLFLFWASEDHAWELDGCGNSAPLSQAAATLKAVEAMNHSHGDPLISGMVSTSSFPKGIPGITISVSGQGESFQVVTGSDGRFQLTVPPGNWSVTARRNGSPIPIDPLSYSLPGNLHLTRGACVQLQFTTH